MKTICLLIRSCLNINSPRPLRPLKTRRTKKSLRTQKTPRPQKSPKTVKTQKSLKTQKTNHGVKRAERGSARVAEQIFRTRELMPSGPQQQSQSRGLKEPSLPSQVQATQSLGAVWYNREGWVGRVVGSTRIGSKHRIEPFGIRSSH